MQDLDLPAGVNAERAAARVELLDEMQDDFLAKRAAPAAAEPSQRLPAGRDPDALQGHQGLRPGRGAEGAARPLWPQPVRPGLPAGPPARRAAACRSSKCRWPTCRQHALGWDTHLNNFDGVKRLSEVLDPAWATLMDDLKDKGLLDSTLIVWMGEFGRTPKINGNQRPRPLGQLVDDRPGRRRHQGRAGRRQDQRRRHGQSTNGPSASRTSWPPSPWPWASTSRSRTSPTSAGPSASSSRPPSRSRRCSHEEAASASCPGSAAGGLVAAGLPLIPAAEPRPKRPAAGRRRRAGFRLPRRGPAGAGSAARSLDGKSLAGRLGRVHEVSVRLPGRRWRRRAQQGGGRAGARRSSSSPAVIGSAVRSAAGGGQGRPAPTGPTMEDLDTDKDGKVTARNWRPTTARTASCRSSSASESASPNLAGGRWPPSSAAPAGAGGRGRSTRRSSTCSTPTRTAS